ncbi:Hypothetical predicted protein [Pelobates cultripes]|uniref:Uncharacterized protein n=1 Tax=Pelobates cultripes TaxID=61616 RepID=A0AAD1TJN5_PELCU|nr:Hypothetical predicted protein [Pelobates cultripes]
MADNQGEDHFSSYQEAMSQGTFLYEDFPQSPASSGPLRRNRQNRMRIQPLSFKEIQEVAEEGLSPNEEEKARRSFLQSLEALRRGSHHLYLQKDKDVSSYRPSLD